MLPINSKVTCSFGTGAVKTLPREDGFVEVELEWGATAYLPASVLHVVKQMFELSTAEKCERATLYKAQGNMFFKLQDYQLAYEKYEIASIYLRHIDVLEPEHIKDVVVPVLSNVALCHLKQNRLTDALEACNEGIKVGGPSAKLFFLRGQARRRRSEFNLAVQDLVEAVRLNPSDKKIRAELEEALSAAKQAVESQEQMFKGRFVQPSKPVVVAAAAAAAVPSPWWSQPLILSCLGLGIVLGFVLVSRTS